MLNRSSAGQPVGGPRTGRQVPAGLGAERFDLRVEVPGRLGVLALGQLCDAELLDQLLDVVIENAT
ncbi:hypothetical protein [Paractinoplanes abujensis]|uniref:Uncharacterized protein n=1 Tax=Paractinoplanes abujensis TaxID=882441 RepID=A0A7W7G175_9ACTN|nr:hypothetical protein [Actinoplanes abujensis]MBB4693878.1 hypothetical protein [Actinoplanes abujensis]